MSCLYCKGEYLCLNMTLLFFLNNIHLHLVDGFDCGTKIFYFLSLFLFNTIDSYLDESKVLDDSIWCSDQFLASNIYIYIY